MFKLPSSRFAKGFTAIELMVTVAILAVLAAIALPSFKPLIERWQVRQASEELQSTLYFARSEAIKRGGGIVIQRNTSSDGCTASDTDLWDCGWIVFADQNHNGTLDAGEELQVSTPPARVKIKFTGIDTKTGSDSGALTKPVLGDRWGQLTSDSASNFAFRFTPSGNSNSASNASSLCISAVRIRRINSSTATCI